MILTGRAITKAVQIGRITIDPWDPSLVNPASVDLRLGDRIAVYQAWATVDGCCAYARPEQGVIDVKIPSSVDELHIPPDGYVLYPGLLYLMHSLERVGSSAYVGVLDGKSSLARLGISVHLTAGYFDPGYVGQATMEVTAVHPVRVYAGMRFAQMRYHRTDGGPVDYQTTGHYVGRYAEGPVPSRAYTQFRKEST